MDRFILLLLLNILSLLPLCVFAEPVNLAISANLVANAEYRKGDADKPTLLLLHGFLQTHKFHTIHQLTEGLSDEGYSVLAPTLTLNIPYRKKSLACESIHSHTMEDAYKELDAWVDWLKERGHHDIILIGHSTGSMMLLAYFEATDKPEIKRFIGISIVEGRMELDGEKLRQLREALQKRIQENDNRLVQQEFSFCKPLNATPKSLLSYTQWTPERILQTIRDSKKDILMIMGSKDERLGPNWLQQLQATGKPLHILQGANHFMDGEYEFELLDRILTELKPQ